MPGRSQPGAADRAAPAVTGLFIAIEGPNAVGKTTVTGQLAAALRARGSTVHVTTEPSPTALGRLVRSAESYLTGRALALAVAADRYVHLESEITPALRAGTAVITDRYVQSSLVLQRLDELELAEIWSYNAHVAVPAMSVCLEEAVEVIAARLMQRPALSRLEARGSPGRELELYRDAFRFPAQRGWPQARIDCRGLDPSGVAAAILARLGITSQAYWLPSTVRDGGEPPGDGAYRSHRTAGANVNVVYCSILSSTRRYASPTSVAGILFQCLQRSFAVS
jgi:dTMP kinase